MVFSERSLTLLTSLEGTMVLNAELESMNSILTYVSLWFTWQRALWRAMGMASSVDLFGM